MSNQQPLIIVDLEATCCQRGEFPRHEMEIIEIGAVALAPGSTELADEFQSFVRPVRHPQLTDFCRELTSITQDQVDTAPAFPEVHAVLASWLAGFPGHAFCSWGDYDRNQVNRDCEFHGLKSPFSNHHRNLKKEFSTGKRYGVGAALKKLGLEFEGTPHRGIDDAKNIARIYAKAIAS